MKYIHFRMSNRWALCFAGCFGYEGSGRMAFSQNRRIGTGELIDAVYVL